MPRCCAGGSRRAGAISSEEVTEGEKVQHKAALASLAQMPATELRVRPWGWAVPLTGASLTAPHPLPGTAWEHSMSPCSPPASQHPKQAGVLSTHCEAPLPARGAACSSCSCCRLCFVCAGVRVCLCARVYVCVRTRGGLPWQHNGRAKCKTLPFWLCG